MRVYVSHKNVISMTFTSVLEGKGQGVRYLKSEEATRWRALSKPRKNFNDTKISDVRRFASRKWIN